MKIIMVLYDHRCDHHYDGHDRDHNYHHDHGYAQHKHNGHDEAECDDVNEYMVCIYE